MKLPPKLRRVARPPVLCDAAATLVVNQGERGEKRSGLSELSGYTGSSCRSSQDHLGKRKRDAGGHACTLTYVHG